MVAIGEAGLDHHYEHSPAADQAAAFRAQIGLAHELDLPLVIHTREAWDETFAILDDESLPRRTVFHCFTGGPDEAAACVERGAFLSFSGIVTFKNADDVRAAAVAVPADRLLVETDSPYLAPVPHRGRTNEPAFVADVGAGLAAVRCVPVAEIAQVTSANAQAIFAGRLRSAGRAPEGPSPVAFRAGAATAGPADRPPGLPDPGIEIDPPGGRR